MNQPLTDQQIIAELKAAIKAHRDYKLDERTALIADHADLTLWSDASTIGEQPIGTVITYGDEWALINHDDDLGGFTVALSRDAGLAHRIFSTFGDAAEFAGRAMSLPAPAHRYIEQS